MGALGKREFVMPSSKAAELLDYYEILGLEAGCSKSDVSKAYRKKSLAVHPDRYKGSDPEWAVAEFHRLVQAKEVLEDDKARAAFDALIRARNAHKEKQKAQEAGRKKLREELEAREADAKRQRFEPSAAEMAARQQAEEDGARAELEREIERLRRTGRLDGGAAARRDGAAAAPAAASAPAPAPAAAATPAKLALRWAAEAQLSADAVRALLIELGAPEGVALAVVGHKGVAEFARAEDAHKLMDRAFELTARGVRASWVGEAPARPAARDAAADARAAADGLLPAGWKLHQAPDGRPYYYHVASRKTQWTRPAAEAERGSAEDLERLEGVTMMRLRQASERQKLAEAMRAEEAAAAEPSQPT